MIYECFGSCLVYKITLPAIGRAYWHGSDRLVTGPLKRCLFFIEKKKRWDLCHLFKYVRCLSVEEATVLFVGGVELMWYSIFDFLKEDLIALY